MRQGVLGRVGPCGLRASMYLKRTERVRNEVCNHAFAGLLVGKFPLVGGGKPFG